MHVSALSPAANPADVDGARRPGHAPVGRFDVADLLARATLAGLFLALTIRIAEDFLATGRMTGLLLVMSELLVVVLTVARRRAMVVDRTWQARVVTATSIVGPPLLRPAAEGLGVPDLFAVPVSAVGLLIVVFGKLSLGRSFGVMPANRGIVQTGLYRWIRHPIYLGYLITHAAFLAEHPSAWNVAVLATADLALIVRAGYEERTLAGDEQYAAYRKQVRWKLIPGVF